MPKLDGMAPWKLFCESKSQVRAEKFPREEGMLPDRLLLDRIRVSSGEKMCTSGGTDPTKLLPPSPKTPIDELLKIAEGISPLRCLLDLAIQAMNCLQGKVECLRLACCWRQVELKGWRVYPAHLGCCHVVCCCSG